MSSRYYLPLRHDAVAKCLLKAHVMKHNTNFKEIRESEFVYKTDNLEYWWNISIKTATKVPHNKPDLVIWNTQEKICTIVEFSCPADVNISKKIDEKMNNYGALIRNLQIMYPQYKFEMVPIIVGALGYVPKCLTKYIEQLGFNAVETRKLIRKLQNIAISGSIKICKTFLGFYDAERRPTV